MKGFDKKKEENGLFQEFKMGCLGPLLLPLVTMKALTLADIIIFFIIILFFPSAIYFYLGCQVFLVLAAMYFYQKNKDLEATREEKVRKLKEMLATEPTPQNMTKEGMEDARELLRSEKEREIIVNVSQKGEKKDLTMKLTTAQINWLISRQMEGYGVLFEGVEMEKWDLESEVRIRLGEQGAEHQEWSAECPSLDCYAREMAMYARMLASGLIKRDNIIRERCKQYFDREAYNKGLTFHDWVVRYRYWFPSYIK